MNSLVRGTSRHGSQFLVPQQKNHRAGTLPALCQAAAIHASWLVVGSRAAC
jgi:hypothetical protein